MNNLIKPLPKSHQLILVLFLTFPENFIKIFKKTLKFKLFKLFGNRQTHQYRQKHNVLGRGNKLYMFSSKYYCTIAMRKKVIYPFYIGTATMHSKNEDVMLLIVTYCLNCTATNLLSCGLPCIWFVAAGLRGW